MIYTRGGFLKKICLTNRLVGQIFFKNPPQEFFYFGKLYITSAIKRKKNHVLFVKWKTESFLKRIKRNKDDNIHKSEALKR